MLPSAKSKFSFTLVALTLGLGITGCLNKKADSAPKAVEGPTKDYGSYLEFPVVWTAPAKAKGKVCIFESTYAFKSNSVRPSRENFISKRYRAQVNTPVDISDLEALLNSKLLTKELTAQRKSEILQNVAQGALLLGGLIVPYLVDWPEVQGVMEVIYKSAIQTVIFFPVASAVPRPPDVTPKEEIVSATAGAERALQASKALGGTLIKQSLSEDEYIALNSAISLVAARKSGLKLPWPPGECAAVATEANENPEATRFDL